MKKTTCVYKYRWHIPYGWFCYRFNHIYFSGHDYAKYEAKVKDALYKRDMPQTLAKCLNETLDKNIAKWTEEFVSLNPKPIPKKHKFPLFRHFEKQRYEPLTNEIKERREYLTQLIDKAKKRKEFNNKYFLNEDRGDYELKQHIFLENLLRKEGFVQVSAKQDDSGLHTDVWELVE